MIRDMLREMPKERKLFYIFLFVHFIIWTSVGLLRAVLPADSLEGIYWGSLLDFGNPKHPPLAGWITYFVYHVFKSDFSIYCLSQIFVIGGFIYTYKLAKCFLDENKAILSVVMLEGCWIYSYVTGYYGFNPDVFLLFALPAITYYFYKCMQDNRASDWIIMGILVGLSCLDKYQTILLVIPMAIWAGIFRPQVYKNKFFYIAFSIATLIFLPHLLWLIKYDFLPLLYYDGELHRINGFNHFTSPMSYLGMQIVCIIGTLAIYGFYRIIFDREFEFVKNYDKEKFWFLIILSFFSLVIHTLIGIICGSDIRPRWGYVFWYMLGIMLFYFFPSKIDKDSFKFILKSSYAVMFIILISMGTMLAVEKNYRSRYPVAKTWEILQNIWAKEYKTPLKYIGGDSEWSFPVSIYADSHPINIMDTYGYKNPWIDEEDLKKHGAIIIDKWDEGVKYAAINAAPYLNLKFDEIELKEFYLTVQNAIKFPKEERGYTVYYYIIPPVK